MMPVNVGGVWSLGVKMFVKLSLCKQNWQYRTKVVISYTQHQWVNLYGSIISLFEVDEITFYLKVIALKMYQHHNFTSRYKLSVWVRVNEWEYVHLSESVNMTSCVCACLSGCIYAWTFVVSLVTWMHVGLHACAYVLKACTHFSMLTYFHICFLRPVYFSKFWHQFNF